MCFVGFVVSCDVFGVCSFGFCVACGVWRGFGVYHPARSPANQSHPWTAGADECTGTIIRIEIYLDYDHDEEIFMSMVVVCHAAATVERPGIAISFVTHSLLDLHQTDISQP